VLLRGRKESSETSAVLLRDNKGASETSAVLLRDDKGLSETSADKNMSNKTYKRTFSLSQKSKVLAFCLGEKTKKFISTELWQTRI
jgi:hypothetical protein